MSNLGKLARAMGKAGKAWMRKEDVAHRGAGVVQRAAGAYRLSNSEYSEAVEMTRRGDVKGLKKLIQQVRANPFNH